MQKLDFLQPIACLGNVSRLGCRGIPPECLIVKLDTVVAQRYIQDVFPKGFLLQTHLAKLVVASNNALFSLLQDSY